MSSSFWLLGVQSRDFSQAEKERTTILAKPSNSQNANYFHSKRQPRTILSENSCHFVNFLSFASSSFFLSMRKIGVLVNLSIPKLKFCKVAQLFFEGMRENILHIFRALVYLEPVLLRTIQTQEAHLKACL